MNDYGQVTFAEYRKIQRMNPSTLVHGLKSMKHLKHAIDYGTAEDSDALRFGSGVHCLLLEPDTFEEMFCVVPDFHLDAENVTGKGERSESKATKYYKDRIADYARNNSGKTFLTRQQYDETLHCIESIREHREAGAMVESHAKEVTVRGVIEGVECKGRIDLLGEYVADVKTTTDASARAFGRFAANANYHFKMAMYRELVRQQFGKALPVRYIAQEKSEVFDCVVHDCPDEILDIGLKSVKEVLRRYLQCSETGIWPGSDCGERSVQMYVPNWAMGETEEIWEG